jgi:hypothetical protein
VTDLCLSQQKQTGTGKHSNVNVKEIETRIMDRKKYITPTLTMCLVTTHTFVMGSTLDPNNDNSQEITPTEDEYGGEFNSRRHNVWDEEEEENF